MADEFPATRIIPLEGCRENTTKGYRVAIPMDTLCLPAPGLDKQIAVPVSANDLEAVTVNAVIEETLEQALNLFTAFKDLAVARRQHIASSA